MKRIGYTKLVFVLIGYALLNLISVTTSLEKLKDDCIFGVQSVGIVSYNSKCPYGKHIEIEDVCNIDTSNPVFFVVHGFTSSPNNTNNYNLIQQFLKRNFTVFALDWSDAACTHGIPILKFAEYPSAVKNTREVGELMAGYFIKLVKQCKVPVKDITFFGHSLGAHVSGFAAKNITATLDIKVSHIIGADPAAPGFSTNSCKQRLCKSDAEQLTVLHTSPLGIPYSIGHDDLYFNNVISQPGCGLDISCSHTRSIDYMTYILQYNCGYVAIPKQHSALPQLTKCPHSETTNCIFVNSTILEKDDVKNGEYSICTNKQFPYCVKHGCNQ